MMQRTITILGITFILLLSSISISTSQNQKPDHFISNNDSIDINPMKWMRQEKIYSSDEGDGNEFGNAIDVDGDYAIIGAHQDGHYNGSIYIFKLVGDRWVEHQKILPQYEDYDFSFFGRSVAIDGDYAIIGANYVENSEWKGCVFIYKRIGDEWIQQTVLETEETMNYRFGFSVAIDGRYAVVGSPDYMNIAEHGDFVSVYYRDEETWLEQAILSPSDAGNESITFGWSVSIDGERIIIGAPINPNDYNYSGSAYVFQKNGDSWIEQQRIDSPRGYDFETFGYSVSIDGEYIAIVESIDGNIDDTDSVYIYKRIDGVWIETGTLIPDEGLAYNIGESVMVDDDTIIVGGDRIAFIFTHRGGEYWDQQAILLPDDPSGYGDGYGTAVCLSGDHAFVGAKWDSFDLKGAVYHFINREIDIELSNLRCEYGYISCDVKNNEDESFNLRCTMTLLLLDKFSVILFDGTMKKNIFLEPGERETIRSHFIFGLGLCNLCITIHNDSIKKSVFIIGPLVIFN